LIGFRAVIAAAISAVMTIWARKPWSGDLLFDNACSVSHRSNALPFAGKQRKPNMLICNSTFDGILV
jgi:hypothetical protein